MKKAISLILTLLILFSLVYAVPFHAASAAKEELLSLLPYYEGYAERITMGEYKSHTEYKRYVNVLLPTARIYADSTQVFPDQTYQDIIRQLEQSWTTWRNDMPISAGLQIYRDRIISSVGDLANYPTELAEKYSQAYTQAANLIDLYKNNISALDIDGQAALDSLQGLVDGLKQGHIKQDAEVLSHKSTLAEQTLAYRNELKKDTSASPKKETLELAQKIQKGVELIGNTSATTADYVQAVNDLEDYYYNQFQPALFIGNAFINKAREEYFKVSANADQYTPESWKKVSDAIDYCDMVKNSWHTDKDCLNAYNALLNAIAGLQLKEQKTYTIHVSSAQVSASDTATIQIHIPNGSDIGYGNFGLMYDSSILEYLSDSTGNADLYKNQVFLRYENFEQNTAQDFTWTITFRVKSFAESGQTPLLLTCEKLRDQTGALLKYEIQQGAVSIVSENKRGDVTQDGLISLSDVLKVARIVVTEQMPTEAEQYLADIQNAGKITLSSVLCIARIAIGNPVSIPETYQIQYYANGTLIDTQTSSRYQAVNQPLVPEKDGYVFRGWYTEENGKGQKADDVFYLCSGQDLYAYFEYFEPGPLTKDQIEVGGFCAIHREYAVEDDFKMLAECGIDFIILDYLHDDEKSEQCLHWAEKYGIKVLIHDYDLNALSVFTKTDVEQMTAAYRESPAFAGNDLYDEPHYNLFGQLEQKMSVYAQVLPEYDMHVNLFPNYGMDYMGGISFDDYVNRFVSTVTSSNHVCQDPYPLQTQNGTRVIDSGYYKGLQTTANAAKQNNLDHWIYIQTMTGVSQDTYPTLADLRFQAYSCLAFGASKIVHYCYDVPGYQPGGGVSAQVYAMRDYGHNYTKLWDYGQILHEELEVMSSVFAQYHYLNTSAYHTKLLPAYMAGMTPFSDSDLQILNSEQPLLIGQFSAKSNSSGKAFMITNAENPGTAQTTTVSFTVSANKTVTAYYNGQATTLQVQDGVYTLSLKPGAGAFVTVQ